MLPGLSRDHCSRSYHRATKRVAVQSSCVEQPSNLQKMKMLIFPTYKDFLQMVSRGGLQHPSDCVFVTCFHALHFYENLKIHDDLQVLLMDSSNPRERFVNTFEKKIIDCNKLSALLNAKCSKGHTFHPMISRIARTLFNGEKYYVI